MRRTAVVTNGGEGLGDATEREEKGDGHAQLDGCPKRLIGHGESSKYGEALHVLKGCRVQVTP
jgi:hypothetical protein